MESKDFLALIEQRLGALEARLESLADRQLTEEVKRTLDIAKVDLPFALAKSRYVLEMIVRDIYRRELPEAKPKPLFNMIEALYGCEGLFSKKITADINYIRINGNLIVHAQDEPVEVSERQVEVIILVIINLVEWYLTSYLPAREGGRGENPSLLPPPPNPYRGLLAFREEDAPNYFGREQEVADVLAAIERQPLVAVVGPSGSGKSSLAFAGVAARLRSTGNWIIASCRPKGRPFQELAHALTGLWASDPVTQMTQTAELAKALACGAVELADAAQQALAERGTKRLLLILDQFEELYTLTSAPEVIDSFVELLLRTIEQSIPVTGSGARPGLCLMLTLRADFLGHALSHRGLAAALDRYPKKLLGPVSDADRLRAIIEQPAHQAGVELEPLLVERILRDLSRLDGDEEGQARAPSLPLLQFALSQLWERQDERRLTHLAYEELGGIQQSLSRHADAVYARFEPQEQEPLRHLLVQMVRPGEGTEDTRQVATRAQVKGENWPLITRLANERLVVTGHDEASDEDRVELIHEALIRHWQPLRQWLREDRAFRLWQNNLRQALADWERTGRDDGALLAGARLAEAEERLQQERQRLPDQEVAYIEASVAERERQRLERERLQRRISWGLAAFLAVALVLMGLAGWQWWVANDQLTKANHNFGLALSEKAKLALEKSDFNAARLYGLHALNQTKPGWEQSAQSRGQLLAMQTHPIAFVGVESGSVNAVAFSPDGKTLASGSGDKSIRLWDLATGKTQAVLEGHEMPVFSIAFSPDGKTLASGSGDNSIRLWDLSQLDGIERPSAEFIAAEERRLGLRLEGLDLASIDPQQLAGKPLWSEDHPNHWLPAAEAGHTSAMVKIGLIYDRSNDNARALAWYRKAADLGDREGQSRLKILNMSQEFEREAAFGNNR